MITIADRSVDFLVSPTYVHDRQHPLSGNVAPQVLRYDRGLCIEAQIRFLGYVRRNDDVPQPPHLSAATTSGARPRPLPLAQWALQAQRPLEAPRGLTFGSTSQQLCLPRQLEGDHTSQP